MKIDYKLVKNFVAEGEIDKALEQLAIETNGTEHSMEVTMLNSRNRRLSRDKSAGILDSEDMRKEENQIFASVLDLMERLEEDFLTNRVVYKSLRFFESPIDKLPGDDETIDFSSTFPKKKTRCVAWQMHLMFPLLPADFDVAFEWLILSDDQPIMAKQLVEIAFPKDWDALTYTDLWGAEEYDVWEKGKYVLEIYCKSKLVASAGFTIT